MTEMKRIAVYCGSSDGASEVYGAAAAELGRLCASRGIGVVYGGAARGTMGRVADAALEAGGEVTGVIPHGLVAMEVAHGGLTRQIEVETLHERKARMTELSDGIAVLPGGYGTLDELFETLTWLQLAIHDKPVCLLNIGGYWEGLITQLHHCRQEGFLAPANFELLGCAENPAGLLDWLSAFEAPERPQWRAKP